jgi:hypothetical protein
MLSFAKMVMRAKCGELSYICCLSKEQMVDLHHVLDGMNDEEVSDLFRYVCACTVRTGGAPLTLPPGTTSPTTPVTPGTGCVQKVGQVLCESWVSDAVSLAQLGITSAIVLATINPKLKKLLIAADAMITAITAGCADKNVTTELVQGVCAVWMKIEEWRNVTGVLGIILAPVLGLFGGALVLALHECCNATPVSTNALPSWAQDLPGPREVGELGTTDGK